MLYEVITAFKGQSTGNVVSHTPGTDYHYFQMKTPGSISRIWINVPLGRFLLYWARVCQLRPDAGKEKAPVTRKQWTRALNCFF